MRLEQEADPHTGPDVPQPPAGARKTLGGSTVRRSYPARRSGGDRIFLGVSPRGCRTMFLPSGEWQQERAEPIMRIYTRLYEPCHAARAGGWRGNAAPRMSAPGRNGSARISSRPEDLTTERRTIQRELQQVRPSTRCRKSRRPRERAGEVQKRPAKKSKIARELKKGMPTGSIFHRPTTDTRGRSRPK